LTPGGEAGPKEFSMVLWNEETLLFLQTSGLVGPLYGIGGVRCPKKRTPSFNEKALPEKGRL